jgi:hypothetical protein
MAYKIIHELADAAVSISWTMCSATSMTGLFGNLTLPVTSVYFLSSLFLHLSYVILTACFAFPSVPLSLLCQIFQIEELLPGWR